MSTIREVSKLAGVSVATVSRVINNKGYVNAATRDRVLQTMSSLNYKPNSIARSLSGKKTQTIGICIPDILNVFFPELVRAIEDTANQLDYTVIVCNTDNDAEKEKLYLEVLKTKKVDGIIAASNTIQLKQITELHEEGIPVVMVDRIFDSENIVGIMSENVEGGMIATEHLIQAGCKHIAHIAGPSNISSSYQRTQGYKKGLKNYKLTEQIIEQGDFQTKSGYEATKKLLKAHPFIDGIFAGNDLMAIGALKALYQLNKKVPEDVKLVGYDGVDLTRNTTPEITTVRQPIYSMGDLAMKALAKLINKEEIKNRHFELEVELIVRGSTQPEIDDVKEGSMDR